MAQGIFVTVENIFGERLEYTSITGGGGNCNTNWNGQCSYNTSVGTYDITAAHTGFIQETQSVTVYYNHWTDVYFRHSSGHPLTPSIQGVVRDNLNNPLSNIVVWGIGVDGTTKCWGCKTNSNGKYLLPIHSAGDYTIVAGKNNYDIIYKYNYMQVTAYPAETIIVDFIDDYRMCRSGNDVNPGLSCVSRGFVIKDDLDSTYYHIADETNNRVKMKVRKWTNTLLDTYNVYTSIDTVADGSGGSQYE